MSEEEEQFWLEQEKLRRRINERNRNTRRI